MLNKYYFILTALVKIYLLMTAENFIYVEADIYHY